MADPLLLYSTNTWLAYMLAQTYYNEEHYVWCNRYCNSLWLPPGLLPLPPSSSPGDIYLELQADIASGDRHSAKIAQNREGLRRGAAVKKTAGIITDQQAADINAIIDTGGFSEFRPLLYVIPFNGVAHMAVMASVTLRASLFHEEYIIESLPRAQFDAIELR